MRISPTVSSGPGFGVRERLVVEGFFGPKKVPCRLGAYVLVQLQGLALLGFEALRSAMSSAGPNHEIWIACTNTKPNKYITTYLERHRYVHVCMHAYTHTYMIISASTLGPKNSYRGCTGRVPHMGKS